MHRICFGSTTTNRETKCAKMWKTRNCFGVTISLNCHLRAVLFCLPFNRYRTKFVVIIVKVFLCKFFTGPFLRFSSRTFFASQVTSRFRSFSSDLYCSHFEVKLVAKINSIAA